MKQHPGIRIDRIPIKSAAGVVFVIGSLAIFLIGVPETRWLLLVGILGGLPGAALLYWWRRRT